MILPSCDHKSPELCPAGHTERCQRPKGHVGVHMAGGDAYQITWAQPPRLRDNGRKNDPHMFQVDHETGMCVVCGWARVCHDFPGDE